MFAGGCCGEFRVSGVGGTAFSLPCARWKTPVPPSCSQTVFMPSSVTPDQKVFGKRSCRGAVCGAAVVNTHMVLHLSWVIFLGSQPGASQSLCGGKGAALCPGRRSGVVGSWVLGLFGLELERPVNSSLFRSICLPLSKVSIDLWICPASGVMATETRLRGKDGDELGAPALVRSLP